MKSDDLAVRLILELPDEVPLLYIKRFMDYDINGESIIGGEILVTNLCDDNDFVISKEAYKLFEEYLGKDSHYLDDLKVEGEAVNEDK